MKFLIAVGGPVSSRREPDSATVRTSIRCGSCGAAVGAGEVYALVTEADLQRCADCAVKMAQSNWDATWERNGWCPWPFPVLDLDTAVATDVVDFAGRLRAAFQRAQQTAHHAA